MPGYALVYQPALGEHHFGVEDHASGFGGARWRQQIQGLFSPSLGVDAPMESILLGVDILSKQCLEQRL